MPHTQFRLLSDRSDAATGADVVEPPLVSTRARVRTTGPELNHHRQRRHGRVRNACNLCCLDHRSACANNLSRISLPKEARVPPLKCITHLRMRVVVRLVSQGSNIPLTEGAAIMFCDDGAIVLRIRSVARCPRRARMAVWLLRYSSVVCVFLCMCVQASDAPGQSVGAHGAVWTSWCQAIGQMCTSLFRWGPCVFFLWRTGGRGGGGVSRVHTFVCEGSTPMRVIHV